MSLGIGGATAFSMASNHQTAGNHAFRDEVKFDPSKQTRVKCTSCGVWANRGDNCPLCKRPTAAPIQRRNNNVKVEPAPNTVPAPRRSSSSSIAQGATGATPPKKAKDEGAPSASTSSSTAPRRTSTTAAAAAASSPSDAKKASSKDGSSHPDDSHNALKHKFRDEVKYDPAQQTKIKCSKCGCWAYKGVPCKLCKNVTSK